MADSSQFIIFQGGLDQVTQAMTVPRGRCTACNNYQSSIQGYRRVDGYERFDGRTGPTQAGASLLDSGDYAGARAARDAQRALIQPVPGSGQVRGSMRMNGQQYAVRDNATGTAGVLYVATPTGWQSVNLGFSADFTSGGTYEVKVGDTITGATSGATAIVRKKVDISGGYSGGDAAGFYVLDTITGTFTAAENLNVGANTNVATITAAPAAQTLPPGGRYVYRVRNFYGSPGSRAIYAANGVGRAFEFDGTFLTFIRTGLSDALDKPFLVGEHKNRLMLGFLGGSVQGSVAGVPTSFNGTAGAFEEAVGDELTDFLDNIDSMTILCESSVHVLTGSTVLGSAPDMTVTKLNGQAGGLAYSAQNVGRAMYLDNSGVRSVDATQAYGDFKIGSMTLGAQTFLDNKRKAAVAPVASVSTPTSDLYRLFYLDGTGLSLYFGRKNPEPMLFDLGKVVTCICTEQDPDGVERTFFGSTDGYVYQLDIGTSFDGAKIDAFLRLPFDHCGSPRLLKKFDIAALEIQPSPETKVGFVYEFDYGEGEQPGVGIDTLAALGGGGDWNTVDWNTFQWSAPINSKVEFDIDGQGSNISATFICSADDQRAHVLEGVNLLYRGRGQVRRGISR